MSTTVVDALARVIQTKTGAVADASERLASAIPNSLAFMEVIAQCEDEFGVLIDPARLTRATTVGQFAEIVETARSAGCRRLEPPPAPGPAAGSPAAATGPGRATTRVGMNPMQVAYLLGANEGVELGGQATLIYFEARLPCSAATAAKAVERLFARHEVFRAQIDHDNAELVVSPDAATRPVVAHEPDPAGADGLASSIRRRLIEEAKRSTDGPWLYGAEVIGLSDGDSRLCFFLNMIIMDAASAFILVRELAGLAKGAELDEPKSLAAATAEIARHKSPASRRRDHDYWRQAAPSLPPAPRFKPGVAVYDGWSTQRVSATLPPHLTRALERRARSDAVSVSSVLLAIHGAVVARWANSPRFTVNVTLTERGAIRRPQSALGDFTSSTLVGLDLAAAESFEDLAAAVQRDIAAGLAHRSYTGVEVIQTVLRTQANRRQAIMPVVFTSFLNGSGRDAPAGAGADGACDDAAVAAGVAVDYTYTQTSQVFLDMQAMSYGETIAVSWDYVPEYFGFPVASAFDAMIQAVTAYANGQTPLPITDAATERAVAAYNQTSAELPSGTLTSALLESFDRHANRVALVSHAHGLTYTYADLRRRSAQLAHALVAAGCRPGDVVVVESTKHPASVINQLAALRAGCAFAPVNAAYPRQRKDDIGRMAGAKIAALTDASFRELSAERHPDTFPDVETAPESLAYVIFTSGSTGRPKGVEISHAGAWNTIADINSRFQVGPEDVIVGLSALSFDLSIYDIYGAFAAGATLALVDDQRDADEIHSVLAASRATIWNSTPALVELALLRSGPATAYPWLRLLMMSGDRIAHDLPGRASAIFPRCQVYSLGGATEGSIWSIYYRLGGPPDPTRIPYGYPLANQQIYVLGYDGRLCPAAVAGEICIGGRGVAVGYRGEPDKTAAAFVASGAYGRLYRTGDVGVFNREGYVDFLGRQDRQIKIRGHRVELGEIEAVLTGDKRVARAQAAVLQRRGHDVLVAFVVPEAAAASVDPNGLIARAREYLPDYMAPGRVVVVQEIPVTAHGKVDLVALQGLFDQDESGDERPSAATAATAATADPAGAAMRELWGRVLDAPVAADDASFFELGGDSLRFQDLLRLVRRETGRSLRFRDVIANPTVRQMTALLDRADAGPADSAPAADASHSPGAAGAPDARDSPDAAQAAGSGPYDPFPLTDMQRAYLVGRSTAFALGGVAEHYYVESENTVDLPRLEEAFNALIARHPMLHAVIGDDGTQRVLERVPRYRIAVRDLSGLSQAEADREIEKRRAELGHQVLEPGVWPQFEFSAFALGGGRHRLFFSVDMILADGASQRILLEDLTRLYDAAEPLPIRGAFRDYVLRFQRERPGAFGTLSPDRLDEIADAFPVGNFLPELPGADQSARPVIRRLSHNLSADQAAKLRRQAARAGVSVSALFCAAYVSSLGLWATAPRVGVNVTTYNRDRRFGEVEGVVGDFTGVVLLSYDAGPAEDVFGLARRVQRDLLEHLEAEYSGVAMVSEIARRRGSIGQATAPFVFTSLLFDGREPAMRGRDASVFGRICHALSQTPQVLLDNQLLPLGDDIAVSWDFAESHFDVAVIEELFGHYVLTLLGCADGDGTVPPVPARSAAAIKRAMLSRTPGGANGGPGGAAPGRASGIGQAEPPAAAPPAAAEEAAVLAVAREHAGLSGLGLADNLFAAGLDSLSFIALVAKVETLAQTRIPLASALADPTVERLAGLVAQAGAKPLDAGRLAAGRSAAERSGGETLVWMRPALDAGDGAGGGVKALLAHGGFGNVEVYADLAVELPEDWEVWGVSFEPAARPYPQAMTIEEVCAPYLAEIRRRFQAGDRLVIVGWSVGGTIAAELAGRLGGDFDVEVILLDSLAPGPIVEVGDFTLDGERRLLESCAAAGRTGGGEPATAAELWTLVESSMADRAEESRLVEALATAISPTLVEDLGAARGNVTIRQFNALRTLIGARNAYFPALTVSRVLAVHASDGESWNNDAWTCLSPAGLEERELDGNHYSILMRPSARITARVIADHARRRSSRTGRA